jgi:pyruvate formate lyase activating enzyme
VLDDNSCIVEEEHIGNVMTVTDVMREIEKDRIFFDESGGGVTFSGGEPLMQPEFLKALLEQCQQEELHTVLDTSGYVVPEIFDAVLDDVDLLLYDLKLMDDALHCRYTGVSNALILENLQKLSRQGKPLWIRFPVIPGITDTQKNILDILDCISNIQSIEQINLLPYHRIGEGKYQRFLLENKMAGVLPPSKAQMQALKEQFEQHGFTVKIGG